MMKTIILSLLSLVFLSGCHGYSKPLVEADEYPINQDLLGTWLPPKKEGKEEDRPIKIYKFSETEYLITDGTFASRAYEIEFREKRYLQFEGLYARKEKEDDGLDLVNTDTKGPEWIANIHSTSDKYKFEIFQYSLSGDNLIFRIIKFTNKNEDNPENDIQIDRERIGEDVFYEAPMLKRQIDK